MVKDFVEDLQIVNEIEKLFKLCCENKSTVIYSNNNRSSSKSKYIDIKFLVVKERIQNGQLSTNHIGTNSMIADLLI